MGMGFTGRWPELHRPSLAVAAVVVELVVGHGVSKVSPNKIKSPLSSPSPPSVCHPCRLMHPLHPRILHLASRRRRLSTSCSRTTSRSASTLKPAKSLPKSFTDAMASSPLSAITIPCCGAIQHHPIFAAPVTTPSTAPPAFISASAPTPASTAPLCASAVAITVVSGFSLPLRCGRIRWSSPPSSLRSTVQPTSLLCGADIGWGAIFFSAAEAAVLSVDQRAWLTFVHAFGAQVNFVV